MKKILLLLTISSLFLMGCVKTQLHNDSDQKMIALNVSSGQTKSTGDPNRLFDSREQLIKSIRVITFDKKDGQEFVDANQKELYDNVTGSQNIPVKVRK